MSNDFDRFSDDTFDETPDWLLDDDDVVTAEPVEGFSAESSSEDEFDQLRRKSARTGSMQDEMETSGAVETSPQSSGAFSWSSFTPGQRLVLALLVVLDIIAVAFGLMVLTGIV
ncbi:MAG: hypothetical protein H6659_16000 [Ardenticatenaceae bacterium]|nr:hypothetical protein [Ardenticatenaceae bacterium]